MSARHFLRVRTLRASKRAALSRERSPASQDGPQDAPEDGPGTLERLDEMLPLDPEQVTARTLWMVRLLLEAPRLTGRRSALNDDDVLAELALDGDAIAGFSPAAVRGWLAHRLEQLEQLELGPEAISQNSRWLASWLGLTEAQRELLALAATASISESLATCMLPFARLPSTRAIGLLARVVRVPVEEVREGLAAHSPLVCAGLLEFAPARDGHCTPLLQVNRRFTDVLAAHFEHPDDLFSAICPSASEPELGLDAFDYCAREVQLLTTMLRGACAERSRGVNVLLYGPPGCGKSQLVRAIAKAIGVSLRQVPDADADPDREALHGEQRLARLRTMQHLLKGGAPSLVLFDEIEDAFPWSVERGWLRRDSASDKARTNRLLEENGTPCVWVGNRVDQLDAAFARRFSLVIELPAPPCRVREALLAAYAAGLEVPSEVRRRLAEEPALMPADMARAARVTRLVRRGGAEAAAAEHGAPVGVEPHASLSDATVFEHALAGARRQDVGAHAVTELEYDAKLVNTSVPLERLTAGLQRRAQGCICLYGPPGTGKTAYAHQLAATLERPLLRRSAGDLLDMYVGGTEKAITQMFDEASRSHCVLLLDEAEGLMRDRASAVRGFEATQVNELLVRMEAFRGIFLCATNGFEALDPASLRRFSLRVEFFPLTVEQNLLLFQRTAKQLGLEFGSDALSLARRRLARLSLLTPGDFAAVLRGRLLLGEPSLDALLGDLERAHAEKRSDRHIGFRS